MKDWFRKISVTLLLAAGELLLGILLLINPVSLTTIVIIAVGVLLLVLGGWHLFRYIRLPLEEAVRTWKLATGAGLLACGVIALANQPWMIRFLGTLTTLYGGIVLAAAFMKLQIAIDALRSRREHWYLMAISFLLTAVLATILFLDLFDGAAVWIVVGVVLIVMAVADLVYFLFTRRTKAAA